MGMLFNAILFFFAVACIRASPVPDAEGVQANNQIEGALDQISHEIESKSGQEGEPKEFVQEKGNEQEAKKGTDGENKQKAVSPKEDSEKMKEDGGKKAENKGEGSEEVEQKGEALENKDSVKDAENKSGVDGEKANKETEKSGETEETLKEIGSKTDDVKKNNEKKEESQNEKMKENKIGDKKEKQSIDNAENISNETKREEAVEEKESGNDVIGEDNLKEEITGNNEQLEGVDSNLTSLVISSTIMEDLETAGKKGIEEAHGIGQNIDNEDKIIVGDNSGEDGLKGDEETIEERKLAEGLVENETSKQESTDKLFEEKAKQNLAEEFNNTDTLSNGTMITEDSYNDTHSEGPSSSVTPEETSTTATSITSESNSSLSEELDKTSNKSKDLIVGSDLIQERVEEELVEGKGKEGEEIKDVKDEKEIDKPTKEKDPEKSLDEVGVKDAEGSSKSENKGKDGVVDEKISEEVGVDGANSVI